MCTSRVSRGAREYSLTNHTGPPALWSHIRLAHRLNYSQSEPIKSNYDQLWIIRMPRRLIAQRDGAASCHFQETVILIVFFPLWSLTSSLSKSQDACWLQKDSAITRQRKNINNTATSLFCSLAHLCSLLHYFQMMEIPTENWNAGALKWMTTSLQCAVTAASSWWFSSLLF